MLKIGEFAQETQVTIKTLRHYAKLGLLKPVWIDRFTGYRYYTREQMVRLNRIMALKDLGFTLTQIGQVLQEEWHEKRPFFGRGTAVFQPILFSQRKRPFQKSPNLCNGR